MLHVIAQQEDGPAVAHEAFSLVPEQKCQIR